MSAPTSPSRTRRRRWRLRSRTTAPARSARPTRCGTTAAVCFRPTPTSRASPPISTPAVPGWEKRAGEAVVLGAGGSARGVIYGLIERGITRIHVINRTPERAQALQARFGAAVQPANHAALPHLLSRPGAAGQHHVARHDRPAAACHRSCSDAASGRGRGPGLRAAGNAAAGRRARAAIWPSPMASACCCIRRCGASSSGSGSAPR